MTIAVRVSQSPLTPAVGSPTPSKRWPPVIWALLMGTFIARAAGFAFPFMSYRLAELGFSTELTGRVIAVFGVGWLCGQLLCGWLSDRLGRRTTLIGAMLAAAVALPVLATAASTVSVIAAAAVVGVVYDAHRPIVSAIIQDQFPTEQGRTLVSGCGTSLVNMAAATTGAVGGMLAGSTGMGFLFCVNGLACALFALIAYCVHAARQRPPAPSARPPPGLPGRGARPAPVAGVAGQPLRAELLCRDVHPAPDADERRRAQAAAYGWTQVAAAVVVVRRHPGPDAAPQPPR